MYIPLQDTKCFLANISCSLADRNHHLETCTPEEGEKIEALVLAKLQDKSETDQWYPARFSAGMTNYEREVLIMCQRPENAPGAYVARAIRRLLGKEDLEVTKESGSFHVDLRTRDVVIVENRSGVIRPMEHREPFRDWDAGERGWNIKVRRVHGESSEVWWAD